MCQEKKAPPGMNPVGLFHFGARDFGFRRV
jgi:hypothetical protein